MKIDNTPVSDNVVRIIKEKGYKQCANPLSFSVQPRGKTGSCAELYG